MDERRIPGSTSLPAAWAAVAAWLSILVPAGCGDGGKVEPQRTIEYTEEREPCAEYFPARKVFFGDLHSHTMYSFDAWGYGSRNDPWDAYSFARGGQVALPPLDADGNGTRTARISRPLDFAMVSDHSEFLGEMLQCTVPGSSAYEHPTCQEIREDPEGSVTYLGFQTSQADPVRIDICGADTGCVEEAALERWLAMRQAAEDSYDRTSACSFVSFVGYEYTATLDVSNNHRIVVFRNAEVPPLPTSYYEAGTEWDLWGELADACLDSGTGCDVMTIAHNTNLSNGRMYASPWPGEPDIEGERAMAELRARIEPLVEIFQHKGAMECRNGFDPATGDPDPGCDFEQQWPADAEDCGDGTGSGGMRLWGCVSRLDFVRNIFAAGMQLHERLGVNPYRMGVIGATDTHNATPGKVEEDDFPGHIGIVDDTPQKRLGVGTITHDGLINNPGGLAAVWAEELSRDALFEAFRRGEVYATSGPRIEVRFFGGWDLPAGVCDMDDRVSLSYSTGSPMGGDLPAAPVGASGPSFWVMASADSGTLSAPGVPLQLVQIVKVWLDEAGAANERIYDLAGDPESGASVDPATCEPIGSGLESSCALWTDPDFDPALPSFWYARILQNPTCRWSAWECLRLEPADRPPGCTDPSVSTVVQERAWTSPIWYLP